METALFIFIFIIFIVIVLGFVLFNSDVLFLSPEWWNFIEISHNTINEFDIITFLNLRESVETLKVIQYEENKVFKHNFKFCSQINVKLHDQLLRVFNLQNLYVCAFIKFTENCDTNAMKKLFDHLNYNWIYIVDFNESDECNFDSIKESYNYWKYLKISSNKYILISHFISKGLEGFIDKEVINNFNKIKTIQFYVERNMEGAQIKDSEFFAKLPNGKNFTIRFDKITLGKHHPPRESFIWDTFEQKNMSIVIGVLPNSAADNHLYITNSPKSYNLDTESFYEYSDGKIKAYSNRSLTFNNVKWDNYTDHDISKLKLNYNKQTLKLLALEIENSDVLDEIDGTTYYYWNKYHIIKNTEGNFAFILRSVHDGILEKEEWSQLELGNVYSIIILYGDMVNVKRFPKVVEYITLL